MVAAICGISFTGRGWQLEQGLNDAMTFQPALSFAFFKPAINLLAGYNSVGQGEDIMN